MKRILLVLGVAVGIAAPAHAALTLVTRETFQGVGTLDGGTPGNLGAVTGSFYKRPVGPRLRADTTASGRGWSADMHSQVLAYAEPAAAGSGVLAASGNNERAVDAVDFWIYVDRPLNDGTNGKQLVYLGLAQGVGLVDLSTSGADGLTLTASSYGGAATGPGYTLPLRGWVQIRVAWAQIDGYWNYQASVQVRAAGAAGFTEIFGTTETLTAYPDRLRVGLIPAGAAPTGNVRLGMLSTYRLDAWADRTLLDPTVVDPPGGPFAWYVNPATGNDANDGTTPASAWASVDKINAESANLGMFPRNGMGAGDTLYLDGGAAPLVVGASRLQLRTQGMTLSCAGAEPIRPWTAVTGGWALSNGCAHTYETTDGAATDLASVVVLEDWKILSHPTGAAFANVQAAMEATPGSFYSDGTKLYVHPFGDTNPAADGKTYVRSRARLAEYGSPGGSVISVHAPDVRITSTQPGGSLLRMSMLAQSADSDPVGSYLLQWDDGGGGANQVDHFHFDLGSKHLEGRTSTASNMSVARVDCTYGQGSPYCGFGGQTQAVDFCQSGTGNTYSYLRCSSTVNAGLVGSAAGRVNWAYQSWLSHSNTPGVFANGTFTDCNWCSVFEEDGAASGTVSLLRTTLGGATAFNANLTADQCRTTLFPLSVQNGKTMTLRNCILGLAGVISNYSWATLAGTATIQGVTIDFGDNPGGLSPGAVWGRAGPCNLTIRNVALVASAAHPHTLLDGFTSADTLTMDHNAYANGNATILQRYDDGTLTADRTLAQWQLLGEDAGSFLTTAAAALDANLQPLPLSPLIGAGADLGGLADYTGKWFAHRTAIGAYEPPPGTYAQWQADNFTTAQLADAATSGDLADPAGDGMVNLLKYAFDLDPNGVAPGSAFPAVSSDGVSVAISYTLADWAADLTYTVEQSVDLVHWSVSAPTLTLLADDGTTRRIRAAVPMGAGPRLFLRLRVSRVLQASRKAARVHRR